MPKRLDSNICENSDECNYLDQRFNNKEHSSHNYYNVVPHERFAESKRSRTISPISRRSQSYAKHSFPINNSNFSQTSHPNFYHPNDFQRHSNEKKESKCLKVMPISPLSSSSPLFSSPISSSSSSQNSNFSMNGCPMKKIVKKSRFVSIYDGRPVVNNCILKE